MASPPERSISPRAAEYALRCAHARRRAPTSRRCALGEEHAGRRGHGPEAYYFGGSFPFPSYINTHIYIEYLMHTLLFNTLACVCVLYDSYVL